MNYQDFFYSKVKPNINNYTKEELLNIIENFKKSNDSNYKIDEDEGKTKEELVNLTNDIWDNLSYGPDVLCPICLELVINKDNLRTNCGHYFHSSCMIKYIVKVKYDENITCPQCRTIIYNDSNQNTTNNNINYNLNDNFLNQDTDLNERIIDYFNSHNFPINLNTGQWTNYGLNNFSVYLSNNINPNIYLDQFENNNVRDFDYNINYFNQNNEYNNIDSSKSDSSSDTDDTSSNI